MPRLKAQEGVAQSTEPSNILVSQEGVAPAIPTTAIVRVSQEGVAPARHVPVNAPANLSLSMYTLLGT